MWVNLGRKGRQDGALSGWTSDDLLSLYPASGQCPFVALTVTVSYCVDGHCVMLHQLSLSMCHAALTIIVSCCIDCHCIMLHKQTMQDTAHFKVHLKNIINLIYKFVTILCYH